MKEVTFDGTILGSIINNGCINTGGSYGALLELAPKSIFWICSLTKIQRWVLRSCVERQEEIESGSGKDSLAAVICWTEKAQCCGYFTQTIYHKNTFAFFWGYFLYFSNIDHKTDMYVVNLVSCHRCTKWLKSCTQQLGLII